MNINQFCVKYLRVLVYAALVVPLFVFPWSVYPYLYGKALMMIAIAALMLPAYLMLITQDASYRPRKNVLFVLVVLFFSVLIASSFLAADPRRSFWGTEERSSGLFFLLPYLMMFLVAISVFKDLNLWKRLLVFSIFVSVLVMGSAWLDIAMDKIFNPGAGTRTGGALNNPIFYAAYLLFHIPLAFWFLLESKKWIAKIIFLAIVILETISLFFTLTRGAMVGFIFILFLGLVLFAFSNRKYRKFSIIALISVVAVVILVFVFKETTSSWPVVGRFVTISPSDLTAKTRIEFWKIAWQGFKERPILGWGPENYYIVFNKFYNPELLRFSFYETWSDKPHNVIFELLATTGIVGTATYFGIYLVIFIKIFSRARKGLIPSTTAIPLVLIFTGYLVQNFFGIDTVSTHVMFFIILAFSARLLFLDDIPAIEQQSKKVALRSLDSKKPILITGVVASIISLIIISQWVIEPARAGYLTIRATKADNFGDALVLRRMAIRIQTPWSYDANTEFLRGITSVAEKAHEGQYATELKPLLKEGEIAALNLISTYPKNAYYIFLTARFYTEWARFESIYFEKAESYFKKSIELSPKRQQLFYGLGRMYLMAGKNDEALNAFRKFLELDPGVDEAHWFYGLALRQAGANEEAYKEVKEALRLGYSPTTNQEVLVLAEVATKEGDLKALQRIYEAAIEIDPRHADWYARLAALFLEIGDKKRARELVIKAVELDPTLREEAAKFLKLLE